MTKPKLVRDGIPEMLSALGLNPVTRVASGDEYWVSLQEKLEEEVREFLASESLEEIADILEVIDAICKYKGFDRAELLSIKERKRDERGAFAEGIILERADPV